VALDGDAVSGVRLADGRVVGTRQVVLAAGPWSVRLAAAVGVDLPIKAQRAQILLVDPATPVGPVPVFSDLVSLQYVRNEGEMILVGDSDHSRPEWSDPDHYRERATEDDLLHSIPTPCSLRPTPGVTT
jgi:sarcosine oxidase subunit beta